MSMPPPQKAYDLSTGLAAAGARATSVLRALRFTPTGTLLLGGLLLPNLMTFAELTTFVDVGLPPRTAAILFYCVLAMCAPRIPFLLTLALFAVILVFDLISTISLSFGLSPQELIAAVNHARHIHFFNSPLYAVMIAGLATTSVGCLYILSRRVHLMQANIGALLAAAVAFAGVDYLSNVSPHYAFGALLGHNVPVESAVNKSGFSAVAGNNNRNAVLVVVESLGYLNDPQARHRIDAPLFDPTVARKYKVTEGKVGYYGATTSAEMRELCDTREHYEDFAKSDGYSCLPQRLYMRGYETMAVHGFSQDFFERDEWYPTVGFRKEVFGERLVTLTSRQCGGAFRGACDADLPPVIAREAAFTGKPKFIYWLTLNTHVPVAPGEAITRYQCAKGAGVFQHIHVCQMAELWHDVFAAVRQLALDPRIGPAEILVVGDHAPPLWSRHARMQFEPGKVPWYRLTPRDDTIALDGQQNLAAAHEPREPSPER